MSQFKVEGELSAYLNSLRDEYGDLYGSKLWEAGIRSSDELANAEDSDLRAVIANPFHASNIKKHAAARSLVGATDLGGLPDSSVAVMHQLFAPFSSEQFPKDLDSVSLSNLLQAAPRTAVPVSPTDWNVLEPLYPGLFKKDANVAAPLLRSRLYAALSALWPAGIPSELLLSPFWDTVGYGLPEFVGRQLQEDIIQNRNVEDKSITLEDKRRDFFILGQRVLLVGGEDKPRDTVADLEKAREELLAKHKGANASLYGDLGYIILIATAGGRCQVFGLRLLPQSQLVSLVPAFEMVGLVGRQTVLRLFINLVRWIRTVLNMRLLPPPPPSPLLVPFWTPSPYGERMGKVELTLHWEHVQKKFSMPASDLSRLIEVYAMLERLALRDTIRCREIKVNGNIIHLGMSRSRRPSSAGPAYVELDLYPCGAVPSITNDADCLQLVGSLLGTLIEVHRAGFVHRDIRIENVVKYQGRFILIDWELAGEDGEYFEWAGKFLPEDVKCRREVYTTRTDLWQIGKLILSMPGVSESGVEFAKKLVAGRFESAESARQNLWV